MGRFRYLPFLALLFVGTLCNAMIVPFMGFFIVDGLGREPWTISLYAGTVSILVILANRTFAARMDGGADPFPLIGIAAGGFLVAATALSVSPAFWTVLSFGVVGFGASSSAMSTMFTLGGVVADRSAIKRSTFNAIMRATTSTSWMLGPALGFLAADRLGDAAVFRIAVGIALVWLALWWWIAPRDAATGPEAAGSSLATAARDTTGLWFAVAFVFCLASAHSLTFNALPLFLVQEAGLPGHAPGTAFSVKTFAELFAIATTPFLIARFGLRRSLLGTAVLAVLAIQVLAAVETYPQMLVGAALEGLYFGLFSTLGISFVQSFSTARPAHATAMYWNTMMVTLVLAGPAAGFIAQVLDFRTVILAASGIALLAVVVLGAGSLQRSTKSRPMG